MAGLIPTDNQQQQPTGQVTLPDQQQQGEEEPNVSPEEQKEYDQFVTNGMNLIDDEKATPQILESIEGDGNPIEGLGLTLAAVVMRVEDSAEKGGKKLSPDVMLHGATELLEQMVELAEEAGVHEFSEEEMESALYFGMDFYRSTRQEQGKLHEDELQQDFQGIVDAEQQGQLDEILPGLREYAANAPQPEDVQGQQEGGDEQPQRRGLMRRA